MSAETLARLQFGTTIVYHYLFVPLTLGLVLLIAIMETFYVRSGNSVYKRMAQFWANSLCKTRGKFVFSETTWNYEVGKDVKPGVDGLIITSDKKHVFSLVTLQQGNDGSATILFIHFNQENVGTKTVTFPRSAGRIMLEPATAGSTTRQGVAFTTMTFDQKTGKWSDLGPEGSRRSGGLCPRQR